MKSMQYNSSVVAVIGTFVLLLVAVTAAPMQEPDEEQSENMVMRSGEGGEGEDMGSWDAVDTAALRKLLMQLDAEERLGIGARVNRAWPQGEPRGWGLRQLRPIDGRLARQWRADKRQVRFRQCYFNPISCFRK